MRSIQILLAVAIGLTAIFSLGGCTQEQIDRAAAMSVAADARLAQADAALALAQQAIDQGKALAEQVGSVRAEQVVAQAQQALAAAGAAREVAKAASDGAHQALDGAKAAQAAGGSTVDVIIAGITVAVPALGALAVALKKLAETARDFRQTVAGVEKAKESMPADQVAKLHAALGETQDAGTKQRVAVVKATLVALLAFAFLVPCAGADAVVGLGVSPISGSGTVDSTAITDGAIVNADVNASAAIVGTKIAPAFGAQNISSTNTGAASFTTAGGYTSTVATGTAPFTATSTTACPNLNASALLGATWTAPGTIGSGTPSSGAFTTIGASGAITSTLATGTAPLTVSSTTVCSNLNAGLLNGTTWTAPGAIGGVTPGAGSFAALSATGNLTGNGTSNLFTSSTNGTMLLTVQSTSASNGNAEVVTDSGGTNRISAILFNTATVNKYSIGTSINVGSEAALEFCAGGSTKIQMAASTGITTFNGTTDATTAATGTIVDSGGLGVTKNIIGKQGLGWGVTSVVTAAGTTVLTTSSTVVQVFTGSTTQTVTLPAANAFGAGVGYVLLIKNVSSGVVTVNRAGSDTINDASSVTTKAVASFAALRLVSDGVSAWEVL